MSVQQQPPTVLVVHESMFGNTATVAAAVAEGLAAAGAAVRVAEASDAAPPDAAQPPDLLVVGGPTHAFSLSRPATREDAVRQGAGDVPVARGLREWLTDLPRLSGPARPAAAFDTRVTKVRRLPLTASRGAAKLLRERGYELVGPATGFLVHDTAGPLEDGELERARAWGEQLGQRLLKSLSARPGPPRSASSPHPEH